MSRRFAELTSGRSAKRGETTSILMLDDPDHARIRQPLAQALYARVGQVPPRGRAHRGRDAGRDRRAPSPST